MRWHYALVFALLSFGIAIGVSGLTAKHAPGHPITNDDPGPGTTSSSPGTGSGGPEYGDDKGR